MGQLNGKNREGQQEKFIMMLSLLCYLYMALGLIQTLTSCYEMGKGIQAFDLAASVYLLIPALIMVWSSIMIALLTRNVRKGLVFTQANARLIEWAGAASLLGGVLQATLYNVAGVVHIFPNSATHSLNMLLGTFILFIGRMFYIGIRLQEEQDLTI